MAASIKEVLAQVQEHARACYGWGLRFWVAVELKGGEWIALHAESAEHAKVLAKAWVEQHEARGASCWRIFEHGPAASPYWALYAQPEWAGSESYE